MSLVPSSKRSDQSADVATDAKENGDSKIDKPTELIAMVDEGEPIVTRKELWSYYCALFSPISHPPFSEAADAGYSNGDNVGFGLYFFTIPFHLSCFTGCRSRWLYPDVIPEPCHFCWLRSHCWTWLFLSLQYCFRAVCPPLDGWHQVHCEHHPHRKWDQFCYHGSYVHGDRFCW